MNDKEASWSSSASSSSLRVGSTRENPISLLDVDDDDENSGDRMYATGAPSRKKKKKNLSGLFDSGSCCSHDGSTRKQRRLMNDEHTDRNSIVTSDVSDSSNTSKKDDEERSAVKTKKNRNIASAPFRLFATSRDETARTSYSSNENENKNGTSTYCSTLREMIFGLDEKQERETLGTIRWIVVCSYIINFDFLLHEIPELLSCERVVVFYGSADNDPEQIWRGAVQDPNSVDFVRLVPSDPPRSSTNPLPFMVPFGVHHSKMFLIGYTSGILRVIIHTSNLRYEDVHLKTQGAYVQDFPLKANSCRSDKNPDSFSTSSSSNLNTPQPAHTSSEFEESLVSYLETYRYHKQHVWHTPSNATETSSKCTLIRLIRLYDYSSACAILIPSVPGRHDISNCKYGYLKLRDAIASHATTTPPATTSTTTTNDKKDKTGPIICQFSSVGSLTPKWLHEFISAIDIGTRRSSNVSNIRTSSSSLSFSNQKLKLIWPTVDEIRLSMEGYRGGMSVPGRMNNVSKNFLRPLYHRWSSTADPLGKNRAVPHIKTYLQLSANNDDDDDDDSTTSRTVEWFVLTSHNLSKAAWGEIQNGRYGPRLFVRHWELGVFFAPDLFSPEDEGKTPNSNDKSSKLGGTKSKDTSDIYGCSTAPPLRRRVRFVPVTTVDGSAALVTDNDEGKFDDIHLPLPYDLHPQPYGSNDQAWTVDREYSVPDSFGRYSCNDP